LTGTRGCSRSDRYETSASLSSDLDLAAVANHYRQQLGGSGWREQESGETQDLAWSSYTFQDEDGEDWNALFYVVSVPTKQGDYQLFVEATMAGAEEQFPGMIGLRPT
jgi:hypothetical protein